MATFIPRFWPLFGIIFLTEQHLNGDPQLLWSPDDQPSVDHHSSVDQSMSFDSTFLDPWDSLALPSEEGSLYTIASTKPKIRHKREVMKMEICTSVHSWISISNATNIKGRRVQIAQKIAKGRKQWFYSVRCTPDMENQRCRLIEESYSACCETKHHFIPAITVVGRKYKWDMVALPSQCVCLQTLTVNSTIANQHKKDRWKVKIHF